MFCANCGSNVGDDIKICPNCGGSKNPVNTDSGYPLSKLTAKLFKVFFEISLWIILILGFIIGGVLGGIYNPFGGAIFGGIISFVFIIILGGLVSIFINMNNNIEELKKNK